ncbi:hypothetical protein IAU60_000275 [Kwoniella sp. DSM 27419]
MQRHQSAGHVSRSGPGSSPEIRKSAADLDRDARTEAERLKKILGSKPAWSREVEASRQRCRDLHLLVLVSHPLSPYAQSIDTLWHHTSYLLIAAYRSMISSIESNPTLQQHNHGNTGRRGGPGREGQGQNAAASEIKRAVTRFRQALASEETFYKSLVSRIVRFHGLTSINDVASALTQAKIPVGDDSDEDSGQQQYGTTQDKHDKLGLVYKALICLGDIERYKEQYKEPTKGRRRDGNGAPLRPEDKFAAARGYYEIARGLQPDDGAAFNQLAVISTYQSNDFCTTYYYFRALATRNAFKGADGILDKFLVKTVEKWRGRLKEEHERDDEEREARGDIDLWKEELVVLVGIIYHKIGFSAISGLQPSVLERFGSLLKARQLSAEIIVKTSAIVIGNHYRARSNVGVEQDSKPAQRSHEAEAKALDLLLGVFKVLVTVAADQVDEARATLGQGSALAMDDEDDVYDTLPQLISAVLRRILPSLRIMSKWIKLDLDYLARQPSSPVLTSFWATYRRFIATVSAVFPIERLPALPDPLEEDRDMKGFTPLQRGITTEGGANGPITPLDGPDVPQAEVHPNEEQLMRLADLQVDAKLIMHSGVGASLFGAQAVFDPAFYANPRDIDEGDIASVSTETEDDPVNLAMRATLGAGSSIDGDEDDVEEVIVWGQERQQMHTASPLTPELSSPASGKRPTAYDLLQNLMLESTPTPPAPAAAMPHQPKAAPSSPGINSNPPQIGNPGTTGLLFGSGGAGAPGNNNSIWSMTREESEKGQKRGSTGHLASIWGHPTGSMPEAAPLPLANSLGPSQAYPSQSGFSPFGQPAPAESRYPFQPGPSLQQPQLHHAGGDHASTTAHHASPAMPYPYDQAAPQQVPYYAQPAYFPGGVGAAYNGWGNAGSGHARPP